jgi:hypothetical protein
VFDPTWTNDAGEMVGRWIEARTNAFMTVDAADYYVDFEASQANYMDLVLPRFSKEYAENPDEYPETVNIHL